MPITEKEPKQNIVPGSFHLQVCYKTSLGFLYNNFRTVKVVQGKLFGNVSSISPSAEKTNVAYLEEVSLLSS